MKVKSKGKNKEVNTVVSRLVELYPERVFANDDELYDQIVADRDRSRHEKYELDRLRDERKALNELFSRDPRSAAFLQRWRSGEDPAVILISEYGQSNILDAINDPEKISAIAKANEEYLDRVSQSEKLEAEYNTNLQTSLEAIDAWQEESGLSDEDVDDAIVRLAEIATDLVKGLIDISTVQLLIDGERHDTDLAEAAYEGEIRGRNAKIEEHLRQRKAGDGVPSISSGSDRLELQDRTDLSALERAGNDDIFERGGYRRVKRF